MVKRKPATEVLCLSPCQIRDIYCDIFLQSHAVLCVQNNKAYHMLHGVSPYSCPLSCTLHSQISFAAQVRTGLFTPVDI